jgi:hypothetical protein
MEFLSWKVCVETDQLDIIINETIHFVIMYKFVIQISLCDELSFSNQAQDYLYNFEDSSDITNVVQTDLHSVFFVSFIFECFKVKILVVGVEW